MGRRVDSVTVAPWVLAALASFIAGLALWLVKRSAGKVDELERKAANQGERLHQIELQMARDMPTKEDFTELKRQVESVVATMGEVRDMVIRLDERERVRT